MGVQALSARRLEKKSFTSHKALKKSTPPSFCRLFPSKVSFESKKTLHPLLRKFRKLPPSSTFEYPLPNPWKCSALALSSLLFPIGISVSLASLSLLPIPFVGQVLPLPAMALTQSFCVFIPLEMLRGIEKGSIRKEGFYKAFKTGWDSMEVHSMNSFLQALKTGTFKGTVGGVFAIFSSSDGQLYALQPATQAGGEMISRHIRREESLKKE